MPEQGGMNIEVAHHLNEAKHGKSSHSTSSPSQVLETIEAVILALVAVTTAWSGYQAARWDSVQSDFTGAPPNSELKGRLCNCKPTRQSCTTPPPSWHGSSLRHMETEHWLGFSSGDSCRRSDQPLTHGKRQTRSITRMHRQAPLRCPSTATPEPWKLNRKIRKRQIYSSRVQKRENGRISMCG